MNDFTKEKLESIIQAFEHIEGDPAWRETTGCDDALKVKLQSMIDNCCKHEPYYSDKYISINSFKCKKCGKNYK